MAANTHLPVIGNTRDTNGKTDGQKKMNKAASFLSRLQLGSLQQTPRPGDVYYPPMRSKQPRPLGLIPNRNDRLAALKKLNQLFTSSVPGYSAQAHRLSLRRTSSPSQAGTSSAGDTISATVRTRSGNEASPDSKHPCVHAQQGGVPDTTANNLLEQDADPDYMAIGEKASEYYAAVSPRVGVSALGGIKCPLTLAPPVLRDPDDQGQDRKKASLKRHLQAPAGSEDLHYFNFTGQVQLFERNLSEDRREALGYEPCERCRLRGGRCARCKVLRTGGGYIILDADSEPDWMQGKKRQGYDFRWAGAGQTALDGRGKRRKQRVEAELTSDRSERFLAEGAGEPGSGGSGRIGEWREGRGDNRGWGGTDGDGTGREGGGGGKGGGEGGPRMTTQAQSSKAGSDWDRTRRDDSGSEAPSGGNRGMGPQDAEGGEKRDRIADSADGGRPTSGYRKEWGGEGGSGRQSHASRPGSRLDRTPRPGSTHNARPGSSLRHSGRGAMDRGMKRSRADMDSEDGSSKAGRTVAVEQDGLSNRGAGRRRRSRPPSAAHGNGNGMEHDGQDFSFDYGKAGNDGDRDGFRGNLMKFQRKKDNVKALHATLKELQGIDPLDYLAKYCIIDQSKVPHYQHTFNNVDRDEDDEIDIGELDFALKAVNYDLISDTEMEYVHSVLELAGRYKLNFRLFSVIAALSEKVVALDDMVKRLINKMDFDALEVKMKKCKELFYLLADSDVTSEHEGGVVTTGSLAVELQAGGLMEEHVEFVVDRLNHEDKGLVEFLDYLTYVPLFVEIHDAISGNPLDFSRTK